MISYKNPIIPGFYPDPSVCRAGQDYYLVTSSFEFFPGIPLFHSRDLIHWNQIGHVLTRKSQLNLQGCQASGGLWAPTIRVHDVRFYVSVTNFDHGGNFFVWTDDIHGEWSDPIWVKQGGIDPSLFWDVDGNVYFQSTYDMEDDQAIGQCQIDIETGEMLTETELLWKGSGGKYPEAPHMFRRNGWYYLMIAEGGTEYGHMVTIARSKSPKGPFEGCPFNPILTHRDTMLHHFQALGHGDLIDAPDGKTWMVFHGIRTTQYMLHHIGRETMIAPVEWTEDGWPVVNAGKKILPEMAVDREPFAESVTVVQPVCNTGLYSDERDGLSLEWNYLRNPDPGLYVFDKEYDRIRIHGAKCGLNECDSPAFVGRRQQHFDMKSEVWVDCNPCKEGEMAGLTIYHTYEHHYDLAVTRADGAKVVVLRKHVGDMETVEGFVKIPEEEKILLCVISDKKVYEFWAGTQNTDLKKVGQGRTQLLSTECMPMTFTGCYVGLFTEGNHDAWFERFRYMQTELRSSGNE